MSISLVSPSGEISIQDDIWYIASSSNSGQTDFKYVFDVFYKGQQLVRTKIYPEPSTGKGYFNASQVVRNEITYDWFQPKDIAYLNICQPSTSGQIALTYDVRVGEDYSGVTSLNLVSGQTTAYNFIPLLTRRRKIKLSDYDNKFMTNRDKMNIRGGTLTNKIYIPLKSVYENPNPIINAYGFNNNLSFSRAFSIHQTPTGNPFMQFDVGGRSVNRTLNGNPRNLDSDIQYYEILFYSPLTDKIRVYLDCNTKYTPMSLHFINAFGMFETAIFRLVSRLSLDIERKTYAKRDYSFNGNSVDYYDINNVYKESSINYGSKLDWKYRLTYDFPTDAEYEWLAELMISPQIYLELNDEYYPVSIINTNYEYSKNINNGLRALEIDIAMNQTRYGFKR